MPGAGAVHHILSRHPAVIPVTLLFAGVRECEEVFRSVDREPQVAMRSSREPGLKAMHTMTQNYATLVSGVLIGLSEALEQGKKTKL